MNELFYKTYFIIAVCFFVLSMFAPEKYKSIRELGRNAFALFMFAFPITLVIAAIKHLIGA